MEPRITELEIRLTHIEVILDVLDKTIITQQKEIETLIAKNASVHDIDEIAIKQGLKPLILPLT